MQHRFNPMAAQIGLILTSILLSSWVIYLQHGWVAMDSILYLEMAKHIAHGDFQQAYLVEGYSWGFYPVLIAAVHLVSGLGLQAAANLLIVLFFALLVYALMRIVANAGGDYRVQCYAVLLLFAARYIIGDIMPMVSRDLGYWAMMLLAVNQLILFYQHGHYKHAMHWQWLAMVATLFRIEGAVYLCTLPFAGMFAYVVQWDWKRRMAPVALLLLSVAVILMLMLVGGAETSQLGRLQELWTGWSDIQHNFTANLSQRIMIMRDQVIGEPFHEYALLTFLLAYLTIVTIKCISVAGWAPILLVVSGRRWLTRSLHPVAFRLLLGLLIVSWVVGCLIALKVNLLSARYVGLFGFVLIIFASFALHRLTGGHIRQGRTIRKWLLLTLVAALVVIGICGNIKPKYAHFYYEIEAVHYVKARLEPGQKVLYTTPRQIFYAQAPHQGRNLDAWQTLQAHIENGSINQYDFLLVHVEDPHSAPAAVDALKTQLGEFMLERTFYGYKHKKNVLVFSKKVAD